MTWAAARTAASATLRACSLSWVNPDAGAHQLPVALLGALGVRGSSDPVVQAQAASHVGDHRGRDLDQLREVAQPLEALQQHDQRQQVRLGAGLLLCPVHLGGRRRERLVELPGGDDLLEPRVGGALDRRHRRSAGAVTGREQLLACHQPGTPRPHRRHRSARPTVTRHRPPCAAPMGPTVDPISLHVAKDRYGGLLPYSGRPCRRPPTSKILSSSGGLRQLYMIYDVPLSGTLARTRSCDDLRRLV